MPAAADVFVFLYLGAIAWFLFWLSPRVNDGRLEDKIEKFINSQRSKKDKNQNNE